MDQAAEDVRILMVMFDAYLEYVKNNPAVKGLDTFSINLIRARMLTQMLVEREIDNKLNAVIADLPEDRQKQLKDKFSASLSSFMVNSAKEPFNPLDLSSMLFNFDAQLLATIRLFVGDYESSSSDLSSVFGEKQKLWETFIHGNSAVSTDQSNANTQSSSNASTDADSKTKS